MTYFGDIHRSSRVHHSRISSVTCSTSLPKPWYSFGLRPSTARVCPVDMGSMKTRSETASSDSALSTSRAGGRGGERRLGVVDERVRRRVRLRDVAQVDPARAEQAHVQPDGRRPRAAVEDE